MVVDKLSAEEQRLLRRPMREATAGKATWEAEIVANQRTRAGLAAERFRFHNQRT